MKQHPVDLLPEPIRLRASARVATSRNVTYSALTALLLIVTATHARMLKSRAEARYDVLEAQAAQVELNAQQLEALRSELAHYQYIRDRYNDVELPLQLSRIIATIVDLMPASMTIERLEFNADQLRQAAPFAQKKQHSADRRFLVGEIAGFARDDLDIADFVTNLDRREPFQDVSLDFSRQRMVNDVAAREFRMSFMIDFEKVYEVIDQAGGSESARQSRTEDDPHG